MLQKCSMERTLETFFREPFKIQYLIDISKKNQIAHTSIKKNLNELTKEGLIIEQIEKKGKRKFPTYKANFNNPIFRQLKIINNLSILNDSNLIHYIEDKLSPKCIILFGSFRKGEDTENSDIDLFIECDEENIDIKKYAKILKKDIQLHFKKNFDEYPKELKNNIVNGIVLSGYIEVYK